MDQTYPKKPEPLHTYEAKSRRCLKCRESFTSSWPGERGLSEVQDQGGLADEYLERIIRRVLEEARARGRDELTQARPDMTASDTLAAVEMVRQS